MNLPVLQQPVQRSPHEAGGASKRGSHRLSQISDCQRAWFFRWILQLTKKEEVYHRRQGTLIHLALAYYYASRMPPDQQPAWFFEKSLHEALAEKAGGHDEDIRMALEVLSAYAARNDDGGIVPVGIETEYFATIGAIKRAVDPTAAPGPYDDQEVSCRIDLIGRINGLLWAKDFKTSVIKGHYASFPRWNNEGEYALKWQFYLQDHILRLCLGDQYGGIEVQRVARGFPFDTDHNPIFIQPTIWADVPRTIERQAMLETALAEEVSAAIARGEDMDTWQPPGNYWSCWSYAAPCDYRPICFAASAQMRRDVMTALYYRGDEERETPVAPIVALPQLVAPPVEPLPAPQLFGKLPTDVPASASAPAPEESTFWQPVHETLFIPATPEMKQHRAEEIKQQPTDGGWTRGVSKIVKIGD